MTQKVSAHAVANAFNQIFGLGKALDTLRKNSMLGEFELKQLCSSIATLENHIKGQRNPLKIVSTKYKQAFKACAILRERYHSLLNGEQQTKEDIDSIFHCRKGI